MASSTRIKGNKLALKFGDTDHWADATSVVLDNEEGESDVVTFYDAANPGNNRQWFFELSAIQSTEQNSFWRYLWENTGEEVAFTYAVHGNETPSADQPHLIGIVKIGPKPALGGDASETGTYTFDTRLDVVGTPTIDDGTSG